MTPDEFKQARLELGLTQTEMGRVLRLEKANADRTVRKWEKGDRDISGPVSLAMDMLLAMTPEQRKEWMK